MIDGSHSPDAVQHADQPERAAGFHADSDPQVCDGPPPACARDRQPSLQRGKEIGCCGRARKTPRARGLSNRSRLVSVDVKNHATTQDQHVNSLGVDSAPFTDHKGKFTPDPRMPPIDLTHARIEDSGFGMNHGSATFPEPSSARLERGQQRRPGRHAQPVRLRRRWQPVNRQRRLPKARYLQITHARPVSASNRAASGRSCAVCPRGVVMNSC